MSYGIPDNGMPLVQVVVGVDKPPSTETFLVAGVAGSILAGNAYWKVQCNMVPASASFIIVQTGSVSDFYKPLNSTISYCDMLPSHNLHQWSSDGLNWTTPDFGGSNVNGGSASNWPKDKGVVGDNRMYLSYWGAGSYNLTDGHGCSLRPGGCCSTSTTESWSQPSLAGNCEIEHWGHPCT